jgi:diguanylate cyclase
VKAIRREPYIWWLIAGLSLIGAYFLMPLEIQNLGAPVMSVTVAGAILLRSFRFSGGLRVAWALIGASFLLTAAGDILWVLFDVVWEIEPFPSVADVAYLAFYPVIAAGLVVLVRWHKAGDRESVVDAFIVAIGATVLAWVFVMSPYIFDGSMTLFEKLVSVAYPAGDLLLVAVVVRLVFARGKFSMSSSLLMLGILTTSSRTPVLPLPYCQAPTRLGIGWTPGGCSAPCSSVPRYCIPRQPSALPMRSARFRHFLHSVLHYSQLLR